MNIKHLEQIKEKYKNSSTYNFSDSEFQEMKDTIDILCRRGVIKDLDVDNGNIYLKTGDFSIFENWFKEQETQEKKELRRNRRHDVFMLVLGAVLGSIFTGVVEFILFKFFGIGG